MRGYKTSLALLLLLQACAPQPSATPDEKPATATFVVDPITPVGADHQILDPDWNLQRRHMVTLRACLKDIAKIQPVISQPFTIQGGPEIVEDDTDPSGCLTWHESVDFNYSARESFVFGERVIISRGKHRGSVRVPVAIDAWRSDPSAFIDLRYGKAPDTAAHDIRRAAAKLLLENASISFSDLHADGDARSLSLQFSAQPLLVRIGLNNRPLKEPLRIGRFRADIAIIEKLPGQGMAENLGILASGNFEGTLDRGNLQILDMIRLTRIPRKEAVLEVALRLSPISAPEGIDAFEGLMQLPSLTGPASATIQELPIGYRQVAALKDQNVVRSTTTMEQTGACLDGSDSFGFYFTKWNVTPERVTRVTPNEGAPSAIAVSVSACVASPIDHSPLSGQKFLASFHSGAKPQANAFTDVTADAQGCFSWQSSIGFDYFGDESWLDRKISLRGKLAPIAGIEKSISVPVNPWQPEPRFMWNCRAGKAPTLADNRKAQIELQSFGYTFTGQSFRLDRSLSLSVERHYTFRIEPKIRRQNALSRSGEYESAVDGRYKLRILVVAPSGDHTAISGSTRDLLAGSTYLASAESEVQAFNGVIQKELPLAFDARALPLLNSRNLLLIELAPLGRSSLRKAVAQAAFVPTVDQGQSGFTTINREPRNVSPELAASSVDVERLIQTATSERQAIQARGATADLIAEYRSELGLRAIDEATAKSLGLTAEDVRVLVTGSGKDFERARALIKLCPLAMPGSFACKMRSLDHLESQPVLHIEALLGGHELKAVDTGTIAVNASMSQDVGATETDSHGRTLSAGLTAGARIGLRLASWESKVSRNVDVGANAGVTWFRTHTEAKSQSHTSSASLIFGKTLVTDEIELAFEARVRDCAVIRPTDASGKGGIHLCFPQPERRRLTESWFYLSQFLGNESTPLRDSRLEKAHPYAQVFRGKAAFRRFKTALEDSTKTIVLTRAVVYDQQMARMADTKKRFMTAAPKHSDGALPGAVVSP